MAIRWNLLLVLLTTSDLLSCLTAQCDGKDARDQYLPVSSNIICMIFPFFSVRVPAESWPKIVYMPHNASVYINCTLESQGSLFWSIKHADFLIDLQFSDTTRQELNNRGLYELSPIPGMAPILRLLINETEVNNNTEIKCSSLDVTVDVRQTTLYLYGMSCTNFLPK